MLVGQTLRQRYKIIRLLGSGAFGVTYLAEDLDLPDHSLCVVKNLKQMQNPEALQAARGLFNREANILQRLGNECPQIPRLFAYFEENGEFYLVQEFIDGHDLSEEVFPGNRLSEAQVTQMLQEILEILTFVHDQNIIHRDIKPENLMRRNIDGKIILIDFGVVKQISGLGVNSQGETNISFIVGTYGYMPSEQSGGNPKLSSDVYALGMLGIYALTGIKPKDLVKDSETLEVTWRDRVSVSPRLADVLDKMVRYHFNQRYQTAAEASQALRQSSLPPPLPPPPPSAPPPLPSPTRRKLKLYQKVLIGTGVAVGVLIIGVKLLMSFWRQPATDLEPSTADVQSRCHIKDVPPVPNTPATRIETGNIYWFSKVSPQTGTGLIIFDNRAEYYGGIEKNKFKGCGIFVVYDYVKDHYDYNRYIGEFNGGKFEGVGKLIFKDGSQYIGEFKNHNFDGKGTFIFQDGSCLRGTWRLGKKLKVKKIPKCK
ncbi:hypothetical protein DP113_34260 (plasmid) [Brasilonema octagenarum UFV-E1]|uniref:non-specific serine/threonine protein kinase n=1 Tax=Brasilonema sennae CENA114 TaxID=415709 RepID=A0A856MPW2_9CYAN|nr:protein kinase [Brasilonema sennae]QDL12788.1 hypothetical protein DP114_34155 [Brasilonema sennae CENA114]QDL19183.1 hypothetical protein DP113_34260 [Brasilonema octagenarum UFV-E1]